MGQAGNPFGGPITVFAFYDALFKKPPENFVLSLPNNENNTRSAQIQCVFGEHVSGFDARRHCCGRE